jgi:hypothetical protein
MARDHLRGLAVVTKGGASEPATALIGACFSMRRLCVRRLVPCAPVAQILIKT